MYDKTTLHVQQISFVWGRRKIKKLLPILEEILFKLKEGRPSSIKHNILGFPPGLVCSISNVRIHKLVDGFYDIAHPLAIFDGKKQTKDGEALKDPAKRIVIIELEKAPIFVNPMTGSIFDASQNAKYSGNF